MTASHVKNKYDKVQLRMNASSSESKRREEGCGKWLTTKGKSNITHLQFKPCVTRIFEELNFPPPPSKSNTSKMKQSTVSQFFVEKSAKVKKQECNSDEKSSTFNVPIELLQTQRASSAFSFGEHEDVWRRDNENKRCWTEDNLQNETSKAERSMFHTLRTVDYKQIDTRKKVRTSHGQKSNEKPFPSPKRLKKSKDSQVEKKSKDLTKNNIQFTQWFENELIAFSEYHDNEIKNVLSEARSEEHLLPMSCPETSSSISPDSDKPTSRPRCSEYVEQPRIPKQSSANLSPNEKSQNNPSFTQWFEENLKTFKSHC